MQLSRKRIIAAAIELIEANGVEAVSMLRLASELGCGLISLYNYVPSRDAVLDGVADEVLSAIARNSVPDASWQDQLRAHAWAFRQTGSAHPRCTMVAVSRRRPSSARMVRPAENALVTLREAGFSGPDAIRIVRAFTDYIVGSLLREAGIAPGHPELQSTDPDGDYEFGLDLLVRAVAAGVS